MQRGIAGGERLREVDREERPPERHQPVLLAHGGGEVVRVGGGEPLQDPMDRRAEPRVGDPGGEPVDGHDSPGVDQLASPDRLEGRILEARQEAPPDDPAAHDDPISRAQALLDEPPPEPGRLGLAGLVAQVRGRTLDAPPERLLDTHADHLHDRRPGLVGGQLADRGDGAEVVVAPGEGEEKVAHRTDPQPLEPPDRAERAEPQADERLGERVARRQRARRGRRPGPYSAEIR